MTSGIKIKEHLIELVTNKTFWNKIIYCVFIVVLFFIIAKIADKIIKKYFDLRAKNKTEDEKKRLMTLMQISRKLAEFVLLVMGVLLILGQFINVTALITVAGVGTIAIGFGAQKLVEDMLSGFMIIAENQFCVGDYVILKDGKYGKVESINIRTTGVRQLDGSLFIIQNGQIGEIINYSKGNVINKIFVSVAYEENLDHVLAVLEKTAQSLIESENTLILEKPNIIGAVDFEDSGIKIEMDVMTFAKDKLIASAAVRKKIKEDFDTEGIEIPYNKIVVMNENEAEA